MTTRLDVWMNGEYVGGWGRTRTGVSTFQYDDAWLRSPRGRPLSLSLPFLTGNAPHRGVVVDNWFDNLLPDSRQIRDRIRRRFQARSSQSFDLLAAVGRECAGAVQLMPADQAPGDIRRIDASPVDDRAVATHLRTVTLADVLRTPVEADAFRISIAGAQEKSALLRWQDRWHLPHGTTPTTHIFKLPLGVIANRLDMRNSVENEWACLRFLRALDLDVASADIGRFRDEQGEERALIVERFDRAFVDGPGGRAWVQRLPQEDLCQAMGEPPDKRYESDGGPTIDAIFNLLAAGASPERDRLMMAKAQLAFWLLAATDGHAKNFSIFLRRDGYALAPLYDVLSAWPVIGHGPALLPYQKAELAMSLRGEKNRTKKISKIGVRHWRRLADASGAAGAFDGMIALVERSRPALDATAAELPTGFPETVWRAIRDGVLRHREQFLRALR